MYIKWISVSYPQYYTGSYYFFFFSIKVEILLDVEQLKEEIGFLRKTWRTKQNLKRTTFEQPSEKLTLLLDWVNAVCSFYKLKVGCVFMYI